jgi:hypothetical protein
MYRHLAQVFSSGRNNVESFVLYFVAGDNERNCYLNTNE